MNYDYNLMVAWLNQNTRGGWRISGVPKRGAIYFVFEDDADDAAFSAARDAGAFAA